MVCRPYFDKRDTVTIPTGQSSDQRFRQELLQGAVMTNLCSDESKMCSDELNHSHDFLTFWFEIFEHFFS